jgi:septal ring factor EnvC (AmiA/AmiB activator)
MLCAALVPLHSQTPVQQSLEKQVNELTENMARTQAQLEESQRQMEVSRPKLQDNLPEKWMKFVSGRQCRNRR